ncbi:zinc-ribbon domain-containing protein [Rummeliibacillus suwonensis]|uniref:zinc-ribbon domain-containing protein n=1 Tax=Rummeliibacillus suwonensis TaxID=1306154 RepID=UPI001AAFB661|nr:zinc-ribbon domain-containing protein [Rummeliibacillus suwonensis]MBO2537702.1 zinc-ribbon domain-containing protein [Rummeliibacillus suwonensis]
MNSCKNCGTSYEDGQLFCTKCGHALSENENPQHHLQDNVETKISIPTTPATNKIHPSRWQKQKMSKKNKLTLFSIIAIIVLLLAAHLTMKSIMNPTKTVTAMHEDFEKEDKSYFPKFVDDDEISNHTNDISNLVAINDTTFKFDTNEQYTFYSHEGPTIDYDYKKTYTIQSSSDSYIIKTIESEKISEEEYDE